MLTILKSECTFWMCLVVKLTVVIRIKSVLKQMLKTQKGTFFFCDLNMILVLFCFVLSPRVLKLL